MTTDELIARVVVPRPNGSAALEHVAGFVAAALRGWGAEVERQSFTGTPHGFELVFTAALALVVGYAVALGRSRPRTALALLLAAPALLLAEFEWLRSPVSGLLPATQENVVGTLPGAPGGPRLVFVAHLDTTTHFGGHWIWGPTGLLLGPAVALGAGLALLAMWRGTALPRAVWAATALVVAPFAAMAWFHAAGPWLRAPSPGAIDNGGSVVALLRLAERLRARPDGAPTTIQLVFSSAEEERALGSAAFAATLPRDAPIAVVNLESIGAPGAIGYVPADGTALRRWQSPPGLVDWIEGIARARLGGSLPPRPLPVGTLTDGRSFLARGLAAVTLRAGPADGSFPLGLHSAADTPERLDPEAVERAVALLDALVEAADAEPGALVRAVAPERAVAGGR